MGTNGLEMTATFSSICVEYKKPINYNYTVGVYKILNIENNSENMQWKETYKIHQV